MIKFTSSDAWLLQAIFITSEHESVTLKKIIATGDYLNHSIFTPGELQHGLSRLIKSNYLTENDQVYYLTGLSKNILSSTKKSRSLMDERDEIAHLIGASPLHSNDFLPEYDPNLEPLLFTLNDYEVACDQYHKDFQKTLKK